MNNQPATPRPNFSPEFLDQTRELLQTKTGIVLQNNQIHLLTQYLNKVYEKESTESYQKYLNNLLQLPITSYEFENLIAALTIGESFFFRNQAQIDFLYQNWLPQLIAKRRAVKHRTITIWSAGCSEGQEIYTIAILLKELIPDLEKWRCYLLGTDINTASLAKAVTGCYTSFALRQTPNRFKERYFKPYDTCYQLHPSVMKMVNFRYQNLVYEPKLGELLPAHSTDLILCRNVFIYFNENTIKKIIDQFTKHLAPEGCLMIGSSERIPEKCDELKKHTFKKVIYYTLKTDSNLISTSNQVPPNIAQILRFSQQNQYQPNIFNFDNNDQWQQLLNQIQEQTEKFGKTALLLRYQAQALAKLNRINEAALACQESLAMNHLDPYAHMLDAMIMLDLNQRGEAEKEWRKTLFLEPNFLEAQYQLGLSLLYRGDKANGIKQLKVAFTKAKKFDANTPLLGTPNMTFGQFATILVKELQVYLKSKRG